MSASDAAAEFADAVKNPTHPKIHAAMLQVMRAVKPVAKTKENKDQKFKFRGIDDMYAALHDLMAEAGIYCRTEALERIQTERPTRSGGIMIQVVCKYRFHFVADDGSSVSCEMYGEGMDTSDKATSKTASIAHKYAFIQTFVIPTSDMVDPDASSPEPSFDNATPSPQVARRSESVADVVKNTPAFPIKSKANATPNAPVVSPPPISGLTFWSDVRILSVKEVSGKSAKGPWTGWFFTLNNGAEVGTFDSQLATEATALVAADGSKPADVEVMPGKKPGKIELTYAREADDVPTP